MTEPRDQDIEESIFSTESEALALGDSLQGINIEEQRIGRLGPGKYRISRVDGSYRVSWRPRAGVSDHREQMEDLPRHQDSLDQPNTQSTPLTIGFDVEVTNLSQIRELCGSISALLEQLTEAIDTGLEVHVARRPNEL